MKYAFFINSVGSLFIGWWYAVKGQVQWEIFWMSISLWNIVCCMEAK